MKSSLGLLYIVMKSDEGFLDMSDKTILIDCLNENVIPLLSKKIQKGQFLLPFFLSVQKIIINN